MIKHLALTLNILALALFVPGIILPMFSLSMDVSAATDISRLSSEIINKELSLIDTISELYKDERVLVAGLILLFSIVIPVVKSMLITFSYFTKNHSIAKYIINVVNIIGKWSMADVFVVAIFLAVMSTNHAETQSMHQLNIIGFKLDIMMSSSTLSNVGPGFYYFAGYCIISIFASQFSGYALKRRNEEKELIGNN